MRLIHSILLLALLCAPPASAALVSETDVTPDAIFGSGNGNGSWQVFTDPSLGLELGLRAKVRYPVPSGTYNASGNVYTHQGGLATPNRAFWNFEYSVNSNYNGSGTSFDLSTLTYSLEIDTDSGVGSVSAFGFDPLTWGDTAFGTNATPNGDGVAAAAPIAGTNVGQNSLNYGFFGPLLQTATNDFEAGEYTLTLRAFDGLTQVGATQILVSAVPEPTAALFGSLLAGGLGLTVARRRREED